MQAGEAYGSRETPLIRAASIVCRSIRELLRTIDAARINGVSRFLYASSACIYPEHLQVDADVTPLREEDAYPAAPQDGYGWEKLLAERTCEYFAEEFGLSTRIARFHNVYGPRG